jgi:hypothetical protein
LVWFGLVWFGWVVACGTNLSGRLHSAGRGFQWERAVFFPDFFHKKMEKFAIFGGSPPFSPSTSLPWLFEPGVEHHPAISPGQNRAADMG